MVLNLIHDLISLAKDEDGSESVEMAILLPIMLLLVAFITDRFILYEGLTATTVAANEALRAAVVQDNYDDAKKVALEVLNDRLGNTKYGASSGSGSNMGWCSGNNLTGCQLWKASSLSTASAAQTNRNIKAGITLATDVGGLNKTNTWCNGHYLVLTIRTHKASLIPSYESFQKLVFSGGPIYHVHTYTIVARVEGETHC